MEFLVFLQEIRFPLLNEIMKIITLFGEETLFLVVALIFFWCIDKYKGYYIMITGFFGIVINQFLKIVCRVPRPWLKSPELSAVEGTVKGAGGYSFPSGHTQTAAGLYGGIARFSKNKLLKYSSIALLLLVAFSRMYLGVHTPADVAVSFVIATALVLILYPLIEKSRQNSIIMYILLAVLSAMVIGYTLFVMLYNFPGEVYLTENVENLIHAKENAFTLMGCAAGMWAVFPIEKHFVRFNEKAPLAVQVIKVVLGLILVLAVKEGLREPINSLVENEFIGRAIRYFLIVIVAGIVCPFIFKKIRFKNA